MTERDTITLVKKSGRFYPVEHRLDGEGNRVAIDGSPKGYTVRDGDVLIEQERFLPKDSLEWKVANHLFSGNGAEPQKATIEDFPEVFDATGEVYVWHAGCDFLQLVDIEEDGPQIQLTLEGVGKVTVPIYTVMTIVV